MRKKTLKLGMNLMTAGVVLVIVATFYHDYVASILFLPPTVESRFVYLSLFWGSTAGCAGIVIAAIGILRSDSHPRQIFLAPPLIMLVAVIILFFVLLFSSFQKPEAPRLKPGQTIVI